jgi:nitronate monooxygenase
MDPSAIPAYPRAYDLTKALNAAAKAKDATAYGAQWAGAQAGRSRALPTGELVEALAREMMAGVSN